MPPPPNKKNISTVIKEITTIDELDKALIAYLITFLIVFFILVLFLKKKLFISLVFSIILSHIFLSFIFIPTKFNIFRELNTSNVMYIFIQTVSPVIIYVFAIYKCFFY